MNLFAKAGFIGCFYVFSVTTALAADAKKAPATAVKAPEKELLKFTEARIFAPLKGSNATAGYAVVENTTNETVEVKVVKAPPFKAVELHETVEKLGRMSMQKRDSFKIGPKKKFELAPGGNHIMLFDSEAALEPEQTIAVVFVVGKNEISIPFKIVPRVEGKPGQHH